MVHLRTVCDNITLTFRSVSTQGSNRPTDLPFRSVSTQGSNRPTDRPFRSVPFLRKGRTVLRIVRFVSFRFYARVEPSYRSSVSSFYRTIILFGRTDEKTVASNGTIKSSLKGLHWGGFVVLTVLTSDRDVQQLQEKRILHFTLMGHKAPTICRLLREGGLRTSRVGIHKFFQKYKETKSIERRPGCGRPTKMTPTVKALVERQMREDDETTAIQPHALLRNGHTMTLKTVLRCRVDLFHSFYSPSNRLRPFICQLNCF